MPKSISKATLELEHAAQEAVNVIAEAAKNAARVVAAAAAEAVKVQTMNNAKTENDHDLIVELGVQMKQVLQDIKELKDTTTARVAALEAEKMNKETVLKMKADADLIHSDHETRVRTLETNITRVLTWGTVGVLALNIIMFVIAKFVCFGDC